MGTKRHLKPDRQNNVAIASLAISPTALTIGGPALPGTTATWTATIENPRKQTLSNVLIQGHVLEYLPNGSLGAWRIVVATVLIQCPFRLDLYVDWHPRGRDSVRLS